MLSCKWLLLAGRLFCYPIVENPVPNHGFHRSSVEVHASKVVIGFQLLREIRRELLLCLFRGVSRPVHEDYECLLCHFNERVSDSSLPLLSIANNWTFVKSLLQYFCQVLDKRWLRNSFVNRFSRDYTTKQKPPFQAALLHSSTTSHYTTCT